MIGVLRLMRQGDACLVSALGYTPVADGNALQLAGFIFPAESDRAQCLRTVLLYPLRMIINAACSEGYIPTRLLLTVSHNSKVALIAPLLLQLVSYQSHIRDYFTIPLGGCRF
jgi:hypothetical protein